MRLFIVLLMIVMMVGVSGAQDAPTGEIAFTGNRGGTTDLYVIDLASGNTRQITASTGDDVTPDWSQDGTAIIVNRRVDNDNTLVAVDPQGTGELIVTDLDGFTPSWSPDRKRIIFMLGGAIQTMQLNGTDLTEIIEGSVFSPSWSPDGERFVYVLANAVSGSDVLFTARADGTDRRELVTMIDTIYSAHWSPDGTRLLFTNIRQDGTATLYTINADGTDLTRISGEDYHVISATWSPDGEWLAFQYRPPELAVGYSCTESDRLYVIDTNGENLQQITADSACYPTWNPAS